ncbi:histone-like nucleoid-structuring protein Lsr2 [Ornithinicoccus halotolerans]|uniref:histone-like nucleoid-structuring protein Lsr2 n=1 Tax=Ornithinicoccus halotolerans TaxID=1748220 RepID=UPI0012978CAE|nr:Lsr2 family protein [Ornithinicoccus halotolerans]
MAQRVQVILVDDMTGGEASETVEFALDGVSYEIDLSDENAAKLRDDLAPWIGMARRSGGRRQTRRRGAGSSGSSSPARNEELSKIREWAREQGYQVSERGRVAQEIKDAYHAAR